MTPIVLATDENYVRPLCVVIRSLGAAHGGAASGIRVIVLHRSLASEAADHIRRQADEAGICVELRDVSPRCEGLPLWGWVSAATYLRLCIAAALPEHDVALYLDCDTLVLGDLRPLLETALGEFALAAVPDIMNPILQCGFALPGWESLGFSATDPYFNAGVTLFNLRRCREEALFERALEFLQRHPRHIRLWDQDALNWVAHGRWLALARCWNTLPLSAMVEMTGPPPFLEHMLPLDLLMAEENSARILHFAGPHKPWNAGYVPGRARSLYQCALARTEAAAAVQ